MEGRRVRGPMRSLARACALACAVGCGQSSRHAGEEPGGGGSGGLAGGNAAGIGAMASSTGSGGSDLGTGGAFGGDAGGDGSAGSDDGGRSAGRGGDGAGVSGMGAVAGGGLAGGGFGGASGGGARGGGAGAGAAGRAGIGGSGGVIECVLSIAELFPAASATLGSLDGRLVTLPCADTTNIDCTSGGWVYQGRTTTCTGGQLRIEQEFLVGGVPGLTYHATMHFYGVAEPRYYGDEFTRESGSTPPNNADSGAAPAPFAFSTSPGEKPIPASNALTSELEVLDQNLEVQRQYFLNSDTSEARTTYVLNYERTIPVIGGGRIRMRMVNPNCRFMKNCGSDPVLPCALRARTVNVSGAFPPPDPFWLSQPGLMNDSESSGQWLLIDVTSVMCL